MIDLTNNESKNGALSALSLILQSRGRKLRRRSGKQGSSNQQLKMPKNIADVEDDLDTEDDSSAETPEQKKARLDKIKDELTGENGKELVDQIKQQTQTKRDQVAAQKQAIEKAKQDSIAKIDKRAGKDTDTIVDISHFRADLLRCLGDQLKVSRHATDTFRKPNAKFAGTNLMVPVSTYEEKFEKPIINVYFDKSGSINDRALQIAVDALKELDIYRRRRMCEFHIYYFADNVTADPNKAQGSTEAFPVILDHVKKTKANNVIIITDSDFD